MSKFSNEAAFVVEKGQPLKVDVAEDPVADSDEVIIKNHAIAINPADWMQRDDGLMISNYPAIIGFDVAGEVVGIGDKVSNVKVGDRVIAVGPALVSQKPKHGAYQKYTTLPSAYVAVLPKSIKYEEGVVLPLAITTAASGLFKSRDEGYLGLQAPSTSPKPSGEVIVVYGASSSVGAVAIQLAKAAGATVIAVLSQHNFDLAKSLGASAAFDYKDPKIVDHVVEAVKKTGDKFVGVYDAIAKPDKSYHITVPIVEKLGGGSLATVNPSPENLPASVKSHFLFAMDGTNTAVWKNYVGPALEQGKLTCVPEPLIIGTGLESLQKGVDANKNGVSAKKVVVTL